MARERQAMKGGRSSPKKGKAPSRRRAMVVGDGVAAPYAAYAITAGGSRRLLDAAFIVIDLGSAEVEIDLTVAHRILSGQLRVAARSEGCIVVCHGDADSIHVGVRPVKERRPRQR